MSPEPKKPAAKKKSESKQQAAFVPDFLKHERAATSFLERIADLEEAVALMSTRTRGNYRTGAVRRVVNRADAARIAKGEEPLRR